MCNKYWITFDRVREDGTDLGSFSGKYFSETQVDDTREVEAEILEKFPWYQNVRAYRLTSYYYEQTYDLVSKVKISETAYEPEAIRERLKCCVHLASLLGETSQESLLNVLDRFVRCEHTITGLDSCPFSFGFRSNAGYWGGVIFHSSCKEWSTHT
jgi:hypothetical protein